MLPGLRSRWTTPCSWAWGTEPASRASSAHAAAAQLAQHLAAGHLGPALFFTGRPNQRLHVPRRRDAKPAGQGRRQMREARGVFLDRQARLGAAAQQKLGGEQLEDLLSVG